MKFFIFTFKYCFFIGQTKSIITAWFTDHAIYLTYLFKCRTRFSFSLVAFWSDLSKRIFLSWQLIAWSASFDVCCLNDSYCNSNRFLSSVWCPISIENWFKPMMSDFSIFIVLIWWNCSIFCFFSWLYFNVFRFVASKLSFKYYSKGAYLFVKAPQSKVDFRVTAPRYTVYSPRCLSTHFVSRCEFMPFHQIGRFLFELIK